MDIPNLPSPSFETAVSFYFSFRFSSGTVVPLSYSKCLVALPTQQPWKLRSLDQCLPLPAPILAPHRLTPN